MGTMKLKGKVALITGAGRGIGRGCALAIAAAGATVVVNDRPGSPDLADTVSAVQALGQKAIPVESDAFSRQGCEMLMAEALAAAGRLDVLVGNPAWSQRQSFLEFDPQIFEKVIGATLVAGFHISQLAARQMVTQGNGGKIIFISSVHGEMPYATAVAYNAAKAGLNHMARTIARELTPYRINVNVIAPGWIDTPGEHLLISAEQFAEKAARLPWGRLGTPSDIGNAAAFLASDDADYITGAILRVDGGFVAKDT
jgi:glucose 1-dehydrogenase